jgi:hypothetical protein
VLLLVADLFSFVVTETLPLFVVYDTVAVTVLSFTTFTLFADEPPTETEVTSLRSVPVMVICSPWQMVVGANDVMVGACPKEFSPNKINNTIPAATRYFFIRGWFICFTVNFGRA